MLLPMPAIVDAWVWWLISNICDCVCVCLSVTGSVCVSVLSKKTVWTTSTKLGRHIVHGTCLACIDTEVKRPHHAVFTARYTIVQSMVLVLHVVSLSVHQSVCDVVDHDHIGWKSWKLIAWTISPTSSLFVAQRSFPYSQGNMEKFWGENVHSTLRP